MMEIYQNGIIMTQRLDESDLPFIDIDIRSAKFLWWVNVRVQIIFVSNVFAHAYALGRKIWMIKREYKTWYNATRNECVGNTNPTD